MTTQTNTDRTGPLPDFGMLFREDAKRSDSAPDATGYIVVSREALALLQPDADGNVRLPMAAWHRTTQSGKSAFSLKVDRQRMERAMADRRAAGDAFAPAPVQAAEPEPTPAPKAKVGKGPKAKARGEHDVHDDDIPF